MPDLSRRCYRIHYPKRERPTLHVGAAAWDVVDLSETGVLFRHPGGLGDLEVGTEIEGVICFRRGEEIPIVGVVLRSDVRPDGGRDIVVDFTEGGVPFGLILDEQRYLHGHYPCW